MGAIAVGVIGLAFLILNWQTGSRVVLLPDANGKAGTVIVTTNSTQ